MKLTIRALAGLMTVCLLTFSLAGCSAKQEKPNKNYSSNSKKESTSTSPDGQLSSGEQAALSEEELLGELGLTGEENTFCYCVDNAVAGLNPVTCASESDNMAHNMICDPLVRNVCGSGNTSGIIPAAARKWTVSEDGKTYTFRLRKEAEWDDGEPLTAEDFEYTFRLMADPETSAVNAWLFDGMIENFGESLHGSSEISSDDIGVNAKGRRILEIRLTQPASYFLELLSNVYPVRQDKYEEWGPDYGTRADRIICSGPYKAESWEQDKELVVTKNENYWDAENVKLNKIIQKVIPDPEEAAQAFLNRKLDVISTSDPKLASRIKKADISRARIVPDGSPEFLMFNLKNEFLSNMKIRQALAVSFDRQQLASELPGGFASPLFSVIPDTMMVGNSSYTKLAGGKNYFINDLLEETKDPKALLKKGLKELGKTKNPSQITLHLATRGTDEVSEKIAGWFKQTWEENLGIHVVIDRMEWDEMWKKVDTGDYEIASAGWGPYYNEPGAILRLFHPENGYFNKTKTGWDNQSSRKFMELFDSAADAADEKRKASIYLKMERLLVMGAVITPEFLEESVTFISDTVKNYQISTNGFTDWTKVEK